MKKRFKGVALTKRDRDLFTFLFRYKVANIKQVEKYFFKGASYLTTLKRLNRLVKYGYLEKRYSTKGEGWRSYYSLGDNALSIVKEDLPYDIFGKQSKSNHPEHDLTLVEIGEGIKKKSLVSEYVTENVLQCCKEFAYSLDYEPFTKVHADGAFKVILEGQPFYVALEYEATVKSKFRIRQKLFEYLPQSKVRAIFYVCKNVQIEKSIRKIEKEVFKGMVAKVYYTQLKDVLSTKKTWTFENSEGHLFDLD